jgi:hypothetical protein
MSAWRRQSLVRVTSERSILVKKFVVADDSWRGAACGSLGVASNAPPRFWLIKGFFSRIDVQM